MVTKQQSEWLTTDGWSKREYIYVPGNYHDYSSIHLVWFAQWPLCFQPSNIFFSMDGHIKIGDFGLVKNLGINAHAGTMEGAGDIPIHPNLKHTKGAGSKCYMSPEQEVSTEEAFSWTPPLREQSTFEGTTNCGLSLGVAAREAFYQLGSQNNCSS